MNDTNYENTYQAHERMKKTTTRAISIIAAVGIFLGGTFVACKKFDKKDETKKDEEIVTEVNTEGLILTDDFDINNYDEVLKRAKAIYELSDKSVSVAEIVNIIYLTNGRYDLLKFKSTDKEAQYKELQNLFVLQYKLLYQNLNDDTDNLLYIINKEGKFELVEDSEIFAYMFMAKTNDDKVKAIEFAKIINKQLDAIKNKKVENFESNAREFYEYFISIRDSKTMSKYIKWALINETHAKSVLYPGMFTKEQENEIDKARAAVNNTVAFEVVEKLGLEMDARDKECTSTKTGDRHVASDAANANVKEKTTKKLDQPKKVDNGGKKVATSKKVIQDGSKGTTRTEIRTFTAKVDVPTGTRTVTEKGGDVIDEKYVDDEASKAEEMMNTTTTTTTKYKDADPISVTKESKTYVLVDEGGVPTK